MDPFSSTKCKNQLRAPCGCCIIEKMETWCHWYWGFEGMEITLLCVRGAQTPDVWIKTEMSKSSPRRVLIHTSASLHFFPLWFVRNTISSSEILKVFQVIKHPRSNSLKLNFFLWMKSSFNIKEISNKLKIIWRIGIYKRWSFKIFYCSLNLMKLNVVTIGQSGRYIGLLQGRLLRRQKKIKWVR